MTKGDPARVHDGSNRGVTDGRRSAAERALIRIHAYLAHLCRRLNETDPDIRVTLPVRDLGALHDLRQTGYRVTQGQVGARHRVRVQMVLRGAASRRFEAPYPQHQPDLLRELRADGLRICGSRVLGLHSERPRLQFELAAKVPVELEFEAGADDDPERVDLLLVNFDELGVLRYEFDAAEFDRERLRLLGLFLLRRSARLLAGRPAEREPGRYRQRLARAETLQVVVPPLAEVLEFRRPPPRPRRLLLRFGGEELTLDARRSVCRIGRKFPSDILVRSRFASRDHASIVWRDGEFLLHDHSNNGTFVRPDGGVEQLVHNRTQRLTGSGVICPGEYIQDGVDLIHYRVE